MCRDRSDAAVNADVFFLEKLGEPNPMPIDASVDAAFFFFGKMCRGRSVATVNATVDAAVFFLENDQSQI